MIVEGAKHLQANVDAVNALNVFPVPDGDTGTNMNLTLASGVKELKKISSSHLGRAAEALAKGLLMGARGNSGVILSQLFRGFAKSVAAHEHIGATQFAAALQHGVDTAYKAVVKPVEGTILTVAREAARHATAIARKIGDMADLMEEVARKAKEALAKTPEQLPVLKQVGVVDAGGQGLLLIYEGFAVALRRPAGETADDFADVADGRPITPHQAAPQKAQAHIATEEIRFGYCTEFMVRLASRRANGGRFDESRFRRQLETYGDSVLVVADDQLVKVHIHAEYPGDVLTMAQQYGDLLNIKIENMREQHARLLEDDGADSSVVPHKADGPRPGAAVSVATAEPDGDAAYEPEREPSPFGFVAVASGDGITAIFESLGADVVLSGGQTMNPSTEDIVNAIGRVNAKTVFVLPNNSNIVMAARQAADLADRPVIVIPSKTIPQGLSALLAYREHVDAEQNREEMERAIARVRSGQVTRAVRDSQIDGMTIREGQFLGIQDGRIVSAEADLAEACKKLLRSMMDEGEVVTVLTGAEADEKVTDELAAWLEREYPEAEVEVRDGGQPLYAYIFSVE
jgi:hypothetical protein